MSQRSVLQPGQVSFHLSLAGAWARAMIERLDVARSASSTLEPHTFEAFGAGMATVLAFYLALSHAREAAVRAPWVDTVLMDPDTLEGLHKRAVLFRDAYMHFEEKAERDFDFDPASAESSRPSDVRRLVPRGSVSLSFGFENGEAYLYAPVRRTTRRALTRLSWDDMELATRSIEDWTRDLLRRWHEVKDRWAPYLEAHGDRLESVRRNETAQPATPETPGPTELA